MPTLSIVEHFYELKDRQSCLRSGPEGAVMSAEMSRLN